MLCSKRVMVNSKDPSHKGATGKVVRGRGAIWWRDGGPSRRCFAFLWTKRKGGSRRLAKAVLLDGGPSQPTF